jgi:hypothetical protein
MTRMWLLPPEWLCDEHLLGEHSEMHQAAGTIANHEHGEAVMRGHVRDERPDDVETLLIVARHDALAEEMESRGMDHDWDNQLADFDDPDIGRIGHDDIPRNAADLADRCDDCEARMPDGGSYDMKHALTMISWEQGVRPGWPDDAWAFREAASDGKAL